MKLTAGAVVACITAVLCATTATSQTPQTHRFTPTTFYTTYSFCASAGAADQTWRPRDHEAPLGKGQNPLRPV
jgi:hypothetical protein